jgi:hypothetical protein
MFLAFYAWHGLFLTDFQFLPYPKEIFLVVASVVYLVIGFGMNIAYEVRRLDKFNRQPIARGAIAGAVLGVLLFLLTMITGVSFGGSRTLENLAIDLGWQTVEQCIGGVVVGVCHILVFDEAAFRRRQQEQDQ